MKAEVEQAKTKQKIAEDMRRDFEKDRDKMKREIQLEFEQEKDARKVALEKQQMELEKNIELSKINLLNIKANMVIILFFRQ